ncbi:MAG: ABC transporter ATP-binding protein [Clostridia bacterium]|nr:ABC transporter ATP-binding protein [Clostridia bacterium]
MKLVTRYLKPYTLRALGGIVLKFFGSIMELFLPYLLAYIIDKIIPKNDARSIYIFCGLMLVCSALSVTLNIIGNRVASAVARDVTRDMRNDLFEKTVYLSNSQIDKWTIPSLISRMTSDTHYVYRTVGWSLRMGVRGPILILGGIVMTFALDRTLCLVLCCMLPVMALIIILISKKGLPFFTKLQRSVDEMVRVIRENASGVRVIKALSRVDAEKERFDGVNKQVRADENRANMTVAITQPASSLILNMGLVLVIVVGASRVNAGLSEAGAIVAFLSYFTIILNAMIAISRLITMLSQMLASAGRIDEVLQDPIPQKPEPDKGESPGFAVEFRNVSFSYNKKRDDLHNISFSLKKGESLGILGPTGAGKSTLAALMLRFYDADAGEIYVDGKNVLSYDMPALRSRFGVVFQNDMVFDMTAEKNIKLWRDIDPISLDTAITTAQADFIREGGIGQAIASHGANISGGQKQRLLIARALAGKPDILILDDSSSALDYKTDAALRADIKKYFDGTTTVVIAQRVSSIKSCDKILVLENGEERGFGTHDELMKQSELYAEIARLQMGEGESL